MEVTYDNENINSFFAKTGENSNVLFGARKPGDQTKGWSFNEDN